MAMLLVIGFLVGGIAGYFLGQRSAPVSAVAGATSPLVLNDVLPVQDAWIVEGFTCPMPGCTNPLLTCTGELPRRIRDWVNQQRAAGRTGADIRAEIERVHGANLHKVALPGPDTTTKK
jgi:hypothetical protein